MKPKDRTNQNRKGAMPTWDEGDMRRRTRYLLMTVGAFAIVVVIALLIWLFFIAPIEKAEVNKLQPGIDLTLVLAPVLAAAAGVERLLETVFNTMESSWRTIVAYLGYGMRWLKSAEVELYQARQWLQGAGQIYNGTLATYNDKMRKMLEEMKASSTVASIPEQMQAAIDKLRSEAERNTGAALALLQEAQKRADEVEKKLAGATDSSDYKGAKGAATIVLGLMLGVIVAAVGQIQMFALLGIGAVPARIDVLITGLVIGTGSYPVHSLVGILQQGKDALDNLGGYLQRAGPIASAVEQKITTIQPSGPGEPPVVQEAVVQTKAEQSTGEAHAG